ncbi:MAG: hypothetical protein CFH19_01274 [Alphaproteobacteria bacterium MarineAlpha5_Bin9]|nr:MAG: hypothetical protein CFH19_01274 [Alphaproteobacteria bacterium MarineAlpha5_Bin9]|tara:strand:+ start:92 stop:538 length:447 start_codon:yes stop_codon:yes gene_type:complete
MGIVFKICITKKSGNKMEDLKSIDLIENKGIVKDRYFSEASQKDTQITLIEKEEIDYFNKISNSSIDYIDFRRNIITYGIALNNLIGYKIKIGEVIILVHRLCDPCKYLQDSLNQNNLVKNLIKRGGIRGEIINSGIITVGNKIITVN